MAAAGEGKEKTPSKAPPWDHCPTEEPDGPGRESMNEHTFLESLGKSHFP